MEQDNRYANSLHSPTLWALVGFVALPRFCVLVLVLVPVLILSLLRMIIIFVCVLFCSLGPHIDGIMFGEVREQRERQDESKKEKD